MAAFDEARDQLADALTNWDFTSVFPTSYSGIKGVLVVPQFPYDTIENMLQEDPNYGQMTEPIISVVLAHSTDSFRTLGDFDFGPGATAAKASGLTRYGTRTGLAYLISAWADQALGGYEMVEKLAGQIQGCVFYNRSRLPAYRHLRAHTTEAAYEDRPELWTLDVYVEGDALVTYDVQE